MKRRVMWIDAWAVATSALVLAGFVFTVLLAWSLTAHGQPASAPASQPLPLNDINALAQMIMSAFGSKNWPMGIVGLCVGALFFERHFKGVTGSRFSTWLGTKTGLLVSSLFTAVVTAAASVASQGWKAIGNACVTALVAGLLNFVAQYVGPAAKSANLPSDPPAKA